MKIETHRSLIPLLNNLQEIWTKVSQNKEEYTICVFHFPQHYHSYNVFSSVVITTVNAIYQTNIVIDFVYISITITKSIIR